MRNKLKSTPVVNRKFRKNASSSVGADSKAMQEATQKKLNSTSGSYKTEFIKTFDRMSEGMVDLRVTYAKNLVAEHLGVLPKFLTLIQKTATPTTVSQYETYTVKTGKKAIGKVSISIDRLIKGTEMTVIYQAKTSSNIAKSTEKGPRAVAGAKIDERKNTRLRKRRG